jgi:hypothetical protein
VAKAKKAKAKKGKLRKLKDPFSFNFGANRKKRKPAGGGS